ncbi:hypothetical protein JCM6882_001521 [Rhodosporidiobolus microsporus]
MREAKRPRTAAPSSSHPFLAPSSDDSSPPTSSLTDLRNRLQSAARLADGTACTTSNAGESVAWRPVSSSPSGGAAKSSEGGGAGLQHAGGAGPGAQAGRVKMEQEEQEIKPKTEENDGRTAPPAFAVADRATRPRVSPSEGGPASLPPPSQLSMPSPTQRRTKEEIARKKEEAMAKLKRRDDDKKAMDRQKRREELAKMSLSAFGFTMKPGISRYGSGSGGVVVKDEPSPEPVEWKPDDRCSDEQKKVLEQVKEGGNVFFTGSAGVGKSFLLQEITRLLEHLKRPFQVTATTGIAALQVSGITLHSWAGVGLAKEPVSVLYDRISSNKQKKKLWTDTSALIIDEISMSPADLFSKLNVLGKMLRANPKPFGGIQMIVSGDFFQLPPVPDKKSEEKCQCCGHQNLQKIDIHDAQLQYEERAKGVPQAEIWRCTDTVKRDGELVRGCGFQWRARRFAFETEAWAECDFKVMELTKVFRQDAPDFIATLEKFRRGICDDSCVAFLARCGTELGKGGAIQIQPTNLYPLRQNVDSENAREFAKLKEQAYTFQALDDSRGGFARMQMKERLANVPPTQTLQLKKGAQVLLLANLDVKGGLVNGSRGVIVDWVDRNDIPLDAEEDERAVAGPTQKGGPRGGAFGGEEWRMKAAEEWADNQGEPVYPVVYFATGKQLIIKPHSWCIDIDKNNTVARTQLPLQLAWALTIHKSQGQSLDAVGVRLTSTFEKGQAYVALSRCRKPEGMKIEGFRPGVVMAHPTVKIFYDCIASNGANPFFVSPITPVNPLSYVPDFDPLIHKLSKTFGRPPKPPPVGSAVLAPGQKLAPPRPAAKSTAPGTLAPICATVIHSLPPPPADWRNLLAQAAQAYIAFSAGPSEPAGGVDDSNAFAEEARRAILAASASGAMVRSASLSGMDLDEPATEYETCESAMSGAELASGQSVADAPTEGDSQAKKPKKKRWRKRVGH